MYNNYSYNENISQNGTVYETLNSYYVKTFARMGVGLGITFLTSVAFYAFGWWQVLLSNAAVPFILAIAEIAVVVFLSARIDKMSVGTAHALFYAYAFLNGITFSSFFVMYSVNSLVFVFALTAIYFGVLAAYGYFTKNDLSHLGPMLMVGTIVLVVAGIVSMFFNFTMMDRIVCLVGLVIFMGWTAYDTQRIKGYYYTNSGSPERAAKASVFGALALYLDFVNIFIYILRLVGKRSD